MKKRQKRDRGLGRTVTSRSLRSRRRRSDSHIKIVILLMVAAVVVAVILSAVVPGSRLTLLQPAGPRPINNVDPISGKAIGRSSPSTTYDDFTIGFCCDVSKSSWEQLSKPDKDAFVARFVTQPERSGGDP